MWSSDIKWFKDEDESPSPTEDNRWIDYLKIATIVAGLIGAFVFGQQTTMR